MLKIRWIWEFSGFIILGTLAVYAIGSVRSFGAKILILSAPLAGLVLLAAFSQAARSIATLLRSFTWWQALWSLLFLSDLVLRLRDVQAMRETPVDFWAAYRIVLVSTTAFVLLIRLALRQTDWIRSLLQGLVGALAIYALVSVASTFWSVYPAWTMYKSVEYLVDVALIAAILATVRSAQAYKTLFDWTWVLFGAALVMVWVGTIAWPEEAFVPGGELLPVRIAGVLPALDQNSVGEYAAFLAIVALTRLQFLTRGRGQVFYWMLLIFGLVTLVLSQTRAAIVGFLLGMLLVLFLSKHRGVIALLALIAILLFCLPNSAADLRILWQRGESLEGLQSFSGRLSMWDLAWTRFWERPLTGYGAYAGGKFVIGPLVESLGSTNTLNTYVEILLGASIWGLIPLLAALAGAWYMLVHAVHSASPLQPLERQLSIEALGVLAILTVRSFFSVPLIWHPALVFLLLVGYAEFLRRQCRRRRGTGMRTLTAIRR
jgi:hypothetical protein